MRTTRVLLIESARNNGVSFAVSLKRKYRVDIAHSGKQGLAIALGESPDVIVLDAASLRTSGNRICARLRSSLGDTPIIHIQPENKSSGTSVADVLLCPPFTARKLINRIERFAVKPEAKLLQVGPFTLNLEQQTLVTPWSEKKLTPKLVALLEMFLQNPDMVLERKAIMKRVWKTDYMGDTRTLDVHIRWLRQVVEPTPRKPRYITTIRGMGYRFVAGDADDQADKKPAAASSEPAPKQKKAATTAASTQSHRSSSQKPSQKKPDTAQKKPEKKAAAGKKGADS
jgi:DNA-binding response OmpR family regulator